MINYAYDIFFETLANRRRLTILEKLMNSQKTVSQIVTATKFEQSNVSHNLKRLERCGFVTAKRNGKHRIYTLNKKTIKPLMKLVNLHVHTYCKKCLQEGF